MPETDLSEQAANDLRRYVAATVKHDGYNTLVAIEQDWGLYGYPPAIVTSVLLAVSDGTDFDAALDFALSPAEPTGGEQ